MGYLSHIAGVARLVAEVIVKLHRKLNCILHGLPFTEEIIIKTFGTGPIQDNCWWRKMRNLLPLTSVRGGRADEKTAYPSGWRRAP